MTDSVLKCVLFGLFCSGVWAVTSHDSNTYMNTVISSYLLPQIKNISIDPAPMPNFDTSFPDTFLRIRVNVKTNYTKGRLTGLTSVYNLGNCSAPVESYGNYSIICYLGFKDLEMHYDGRMKYGRVPSFSIQASAKAKGTTILVEVTTSPIRNIPDLRRYDVREVGVISPKFTGIGPLNRYLDMLTNTFLRTATSELMHLLNFQFKDAIAKSVPRITMPTV